MTIGQAQPQNYPQQLQEKIDLTRSQFAPFYGGQLDVFESPVSHFRMRAEFKIWHDGDTSFYAMFEPGQYKVPVKIDAFTIGSQTIARLMPALLEKINQSPILRQRLFQVEFLTTTTNQALITMIYHKSLGEDWIAQARDLERQLNCKMIGRSRKQKIVISEDYVIESLQLSSGEYHYQQVETGFTQPNASVCRHMLNWAVDKTQSIGGDLVELYCGNGNFTIPLSKNFTRVVATEVSKTSTKSAAYNMQLNAVDNITMLRMSSEEFTEAQQKQREFRRLKDIDLESYDFRCIFVDPPRAGLDENTEQMISRFDTILYISCNPETLYKNLQTLCITHQVKAMALFDQFPYTHHRECGVLLQRKNATHNQIP